MRIVVLGATGNVGSRFVVAAAEAGHEVVAYARRPEAVATRPGVEVVAGAADDAATLSQAARGADAVLCSITGAMTDGTFMQRMLPKVVQATQRAGVERFVLVSAFGAGDTARKASGFAKLIYGGLLRGFFTDKARSEAILPGSGLAYTIVYPVNLKDGPAAPQVTVKPLDQVGKVPGLPTLPFANVAAALVDIVTDPRTVGQRLLITTQGGWRPTG